MPPTVFATAPVRALLAGAVDYAGLFPPANLDLTRALTEYLSVRATDERWALGRFVLPVGSLGELTKSLRRGQVGPEDPEPIRLAAVTGSDVPADVEVIDRFSQESPGGAGVDAVEVRAPTPDAARAALAALPAHWLRYLEVSPGGALSDTLDLVKDAGAFAKLRTGGVTPDAFPSPEAVLDVLEGCAIRRLPFKATAGLHHPVRGTYRLTYAPEAETALMYGYLNLLGAAALLWTGHSRADAREVLLESASASFRLEPGGLRILGHHFRAETLHGVRSEFAHGFGSCSFREPLDELLPLVEA